MEDVHVAQIGVLLEFAGGQVRGTEPEIVTGGREVELMAIEVIALGTGEADIEGVAFTPCAGREGLVDRQEVAAGCLTR